MTNRNHPVFNRGDLVRVRTRRVSSASLVEFAFLPGVCSWERGEFDYLGIVCTRVTPLVVGVRRLDDQMSPFSCQTAQLELVQQGEQ